MAQRRKELTISPAEAASTILTGGLLAFGICVVCLAGTAGLISLGKLGEDVMFQACCLGSVLGALVGGIYTARTCRCRMLPVALGTALLYFLMWVLIGVMFYGEISLPAAGAFFAASLAGGILAGILSAGVKIRRN